MNTVEMWSAFLDTFDLDRDHPDVQPFLGWLLEQHAVELSNELMKAAETEDLKEDVQVGLRYASYRLFPHAPMA